MNGDHEFENAMPYPWGGYRFVCSCGASGLVVPDEEAARADHRRHAAIQAAGYVPAEIELYVLGPEPTKEGEE